MGTFARKAPSSFAGRFLQDQEMAFSNLSALAAEIRPTLGARRRSSPQGPSGPSPEEGRRPGGPEGGAGGSPGERVEGAQVRGGGQEAFIPGTGALGGGGPEARVQEGGDCPGVGLGIPERLARRDAWGAHPDPHGRSPLSRRALSLRPRPRSHGSPGGRARGGQMRPQPHSPSKRSGRNPGRAGRRGHTRGRWGAGQRLGGSSPAVEKGWEAPA